MLRSPDFTANVGATYKTGLAAGELTLSGNLYFIPPLMQEFGWPSSSIALIGATSALSVVCQPVAGRLVDRFGVRPVALFGVFMGAVVYILMSLMTGQFWVFLALVMLQMVLVCSTTGAVVYSRLIAQTFDRARGLALATAVCAPSIVGALAVPLLTDFITSHGWRSGYLLAAAGTFFVGLLAVPLVPREHRVAPAQRPAASSAARRKACGRSCAAARFS